MARETTPTATAPIPAGALRVLQGDAVLPQYITAATTLTDTTIRCTVIGDDGSTRKIDVGPFTCATLSTLSGATGSPGQAFGVPVNGWIVEMVMVSGTWGSVTPVIPGSFWLEMLVIDNSATIASTTIRSRAARFASQVHTTASSAYGAWHWRAGMPNQAPNFDLTTPPKLFTFQGTVANGAGGAGDQTLTIVAPSGGRVHLLYGAITNQDTVARAASMTITDGTNLLHTAAFNSALGAGNQLPIPSTNVTDAASFTGTNGGIMPYWIAGAMQIVLKVAAVAASQDSAYAVVLEVYGGAPTPTLAGASTPVLTTNTSAFMAG